jgi:hypothetical protein
VDCLFKPANFKPLQAGAHGEGPLLAASRLITDRRRAILRRLAVKLS